jgi:DNA-binding transcriptional MocR family regulator
MLAKALNVSRTTTVNAYDALRAEGLIQRRLGSGTYVCTKNPLASRFRPELFSSAQTTSFNEPDLPDHADEIEFTSAVFPGERDVLVGALDRLSRVSQRLFSSLGYSAVGSPELRDAIATYLTARGLLSRTDEILITSGAQQAISLIATLLLDTGDIVLAEDPTWVGALDAFRACGAKLVSVPVDSHGVQSSHCRDLASKYSEIV